LTQYKFFGFNEKMNEFGQLRQRFTWKAIYGCAGRYVLKQAAGSMTPGDLAGSNAEVEVFYVQAAADPVFVVRFKHGGLISYRKADGTYVHTLNTAAGFAKKLAMLGIELK
jgi:hypothetical protein